MISTLKGTKKSKRAFVSFKSREYSCAIFSGLHIWGWCWWLPIAFRASAMVSLPMGTSVSSTRPNGDAGTLNLRSRRCSLPAVTSFDTWGKNKQWRITIMNNKNQHLKTFGQCTCKSHTGKSGLKLWMTDWLISQVQKVPYRNTARTSTLPLGYFVA